MSIYTKTITVDVPATVIYAQWMKFEEFPLFMEFVREVRRIPGDRFYWCMQIGAVVKEWEGIVDRMLPNRELHWRSVTKTKMAGGVTLEALSDETTHVTLLLDYQPDSLIESLGENLGLISAMLENDLRNFKTFIEAANARGTEPQLERAVGGGGGVQNTILAQARAAGRRFSSGR